MFSSTNSDRNGGNISFNGIYFYSTSGAGTLILDGSRLIRIYFDGVNFLNVDGLFNVPSTNVSPYNFTQTIYLSNCKVVGGTGYFANTFTAYDFSFDHSIMEQRDAGFYVYNFHSVRVEDSLIEGLTGRAFYGNSGRSFTWSDNYMEANAYTTMQPYIEFTSTDPTSASVTIRDNTIIGNTSQSVNAYYAIKFASVFNNLKIGGNSCSSSLYQVTNIWSISPEFLKEAYRERIETIGCYVVNTTLPQPVIMGGHTLVRDACMPFADSAGIAVTRVTTVADVPSHVTLYSTPELGALLQVATATAQAGIKTRQFQLSSNTNYVIGISGYARLGTGAQPNTLIKLLNSSNTIIWSTTLDWQNQLTTKRIDNFFSLPPFNVSTTGLYTIQIELDPSGGNIPVGAGIYFGGITIQTGTIATAFNQYRMESTWNGEALRMGSYVLWLDATGSYRMKNSSPTFDTDGAIIGSQSDSGTTANRPVSPTPWQTYGDSTIGKPVWCKTVGTKEVDTLTLSAGATTSGNITITLNGVATTVAVTAGQTAGQVGDAIRAKAFTGWTVGGTSGSATVTFTRTQPGTNSAPAFADTGTTGVTTSSFTATTAGTNNVWVDSTGATV